MMRADSRSSDHKAVLQDSQDCWTLASPRPVGTLQRRRSHPFDVITSHLDDRVRPLQRTQHQRHHELSRVLLPERLRWSPGRGARTRGGDIPAAAAAP